MLRIAEDRGVLSGNGESGRLAQGIEDWLTVCESQITPILNQTSDASTAKDNVIDFSSKRAARGRHDPAPQTRAEPGAEAKKAPSEQNWAELRAQLRMISAAVTNA
jgi:hypothetical protein